MIKPCQDPNFLETLILFSKIINWIKFITALVIVITGMLTFAKAVIGKDDDLKKAFTKFKNKLLLGTAIFLIPIIFQWLFFTSVPILRDCKSNMNDESISELRQSMEEREYSFNIVKKEVNLDKYSNSTSAVDFKSAGNDEKMLAFVFGWEGSSATCDNGNGYVGEDQNDGTVTAGHGVTNALQFKVKNYGATYSNYFPMKVGSCYPKSVIDDIAIQELQSKIDSIFNVAKKYGTTLNTNQAVAIISLAYNAGDSKIEKAISAYASDGNEGYWNYTSKIIHSCKKVYDKDIKRYEDVCTELSGLKKRRDGEYELFQNGFTDNVLKFYSRKMLYF